MREVIFRGKDERTKEWRIGSLLDFDRDSGYLYIVEPYHGASSLPVFELVHDRAHFVIPETVGQYTGLKDRNGVRIFEGDVIKTHYANTPKADFIEQVVFHNGRFCGMYERDKMKMWATLPDGIKHLPMDKSVYMECCEVIGNVHDNPELLKEA